MWTQFWDMRSGGGTKEPPYEKIYIEAPEEEAQVIFYNRFGHAADRVTRSCCGEDYSVLSHKSLAKLTDFHRRPARTLLDDYLKRPDVLVIRAKDIKPEERTGSVPRQGYVWMD